MTKAYVPSVSGLFDISPSFAAAPFVGAISRGELTSAPAHERESARLFLFAPEPESAWANGMTIETPTASDESPRGVALFDIF